jgi:cytochrome c
MRCRFAGVALVALTFAAAAARPVWADAAKGGQLAQLWCANCHVVGAAPAGVVQQGPPSFRSIARSGMSTEQIRTFLLHPHGAMPDLSLTRSEIDDLLGYIQTLR